MDEAALRVAVGDLRRAARPTGSPPPGHLAGDGWRARLLGGGTTHVVYRLTGGTRRLCVKVFTDDRRDESRRESDALRLLAAARDGPGRPAWAALVPSPVLWDAGPPAALAMTWVDGEGLGGRDLTDRQVEALARSLIALQGVPVAASVPAARNAPGAVLQRTRRLWPAVVRTTARDPALAAACRAVGAWLGSDDADRVRSMPLTCFGRGDTNLANCLWDGQRVAFVDFEDSGRSHPAWDLGDMAEHIQSSACPEPTWGGLAAGLGFGPADRAVVHRARRLTAACWLALLVVDDRARRLNPPDRVHQQATRAASLVG